ncbi:MAG: PrsW family intramembrane metalloprotease, partial [Euryarchaeota archaeon]|nr:PrsW family intramembrane metalloprotease [Euryarchaeota archaeon]
ANIALMLFYVPLFVGLIYSLSAEFFSPRDIFAYIPFNLISRAVSGEGFSTFAFGVVLLFLMLTSALGLRFATFLAGRDDVVFGPRPGIGRLLLDACEEVLRGRGATGGVLLALLLSPAVFVAAVSVEVAVALLYAWLLGYSSGAVYLLVVSLAAVEEVFKLLPLAIVLRRRRCWVTPKAVISIGTASALGFFALETLAVGAAALVVFGVPLSTILYTRASTTLIMHIAASALASLALYRRGRLGAALLLLAIAVHSLFNLTVVGVVV